MKRLFLLVTTMLIVLAACKSSAETSGDGTGAFGAKISTDGAKPITELTTLMGDKTMVPNLKISGEILKSCQNKGCWMTVKNGDKEVRVTFKDYAFFVPKNCAGKTAYMEGLAKWDTTKVDVLRHLAEDGGMSKEEAEKKYTKDEVELTFEATGVVIK